jgi:hypothetical protein
MVSSVHEVARYTKNTYEVQWNLDLSFFKGMEKTNDECGKTINPGNYFFFKQKKVVHCLLLLGRILPQLKI